MNITRRSVMRAAAMAALPSFAIAAPKKKPAGTKWKVGVTDWNLNLGGNVEAVALAK